MEYIKFDCDDEIEVEIDRNFLALVVELVLGIFAVLRLRGRGRVFFYRPRGAFAENVVVPP
jgi:hypothetical protein